MLLAIFNFIYTTGRHFNHKCMMVFSVVRSYGKLSAKFLLLSLGTPMVIEKVGLMSYF